MNKRSCILILSLFFYGITAWADAPSTNPITINLPQLRTNSIPTPSPIDFIIKGLRVCLAKTTSPAQHACPYPATTDSSTGYNFTWVCSNGPNCIYTNIKQSPTAQTWTQINGNKIQVGYGETQATMVPLLQTTITLPSSWVCQVLSDNKTVRCKLIKTMVWQCPGTARKIGGGSNTPFYQMTVTQSVMQAGVLNQTNTINVNGQQTLDRLFSPDQANLSSAASNGSILTCNFTYVEPNRIGRGHTTSSYPISYDTGMSNCSAYQSNGIQCIMNGTK